MDVVNWDVSKWSAASGQISGMWMAIGWGKRNLNNADLAHCYCVFTNTTLEMSCLDAKSSSSGERTYESLEDNQIYNVSTPVGKDFKKFPSTTRGNFSVIFSRPFMTGDTVDDVIIKNAKIDIAWATGVMNTGDSEVLYQGSSFFDLTHIPDGEYTKYVYESDDDASSTFSFTVSLFLALLALAFY